jgi:hypothetical protein
MGDRSKAICRENRGSHIHKLIELLFVDDAIGWVAIDRLESQDRVEEPVVEVHVRNRWPIAVRSQNNLESNFVLN